MSAPRENLIRAMPFDVVTRADDDTVSDGRTLEGYGAVFDEPTLIDSWEGTFYEKIRKGAFRKSLRERTPVMQFDHGRHPLIGSIPLGRISDLREDDQGLFVSARLSDNWLIEPIRDAIRDEAVDGMSFRFSVVRDEWRDQAGKVVKDRELWDLLWDAGERGPLERTLTEVKLHEVGPVVWPAYEQTTVGVRARSVAAEIHADHDLRQRIRASLALQRDTLADLDAPEELQDQGTRREVATAILFDPHPDAPPDPGHPSEPQPREDAGLSHVRDAPPDPGHPSPDDPDAPPSDGHPTGDVNLSRLDPNRLRRDAEQRAGYLALIEKRSSRYER